MCELYIEFSVDGVECRNMNPTGSFFKFFLGFLTFISVSFIITFAVGAYTVVQEEQKQTAAAFKALVD